MISSKNNKVFLILSIIGFLINFISYYPGFLSPDSLDQFTQALNNSYADWHPPIMSGLWHILLVFYYGPQCMLFFQLVLLWTSFYFLLILFKRNYGNLFWLVFIFIAAPFVQNFAGNIWKDVHMAFAWLLATSIMLVAFFRNRKMDTYEAIASILLLSYGCWVRINALPGLIPLLCLWLMLLKTNKPPKKHVVIRLSIKAFFISILVVLTQIVITKTILKPHKSYGEYKLFMHDLSGIYVETNKLCFPDFIKNYPRFDTLYLKQNYHYSTFDNIWWNSDHKYLLPAVNDTTIKELRNYWLHTIADNPLVYLKNRTKGYLAFLRITTSESSLCNMYPYIHPNSYGLVRKSNFLSKTIIPLLNAQSDTFYMKPWFWFLFNILIFFAAFIKRLAFIKPIILTLSLSGLFYLGFEFFVFQVDTDFRYFYWNCISEFLVFILICAEIYKSCLKPDNRSTILASH
ncbi:MAG: hypothetical protein V4506_15130 [Bacteroidota bacterium]